MRSIARVVPFAVALVVSTSAFAADAPKASLAARLRAPTGRAALVERVTLPDGESLEVELVAISAWTPHTALVRGADLEPLRYDSSRVKIYSGHVRRDGRVDRASHVFVATTPGGAIGHVERLGGRASFAEGDFLDRPSEKGRESGGLPPNRPLCGCGAEHESHAFNAAPEGRARAEGGLAGATIPVSAPRVVQLAVDSDYEFFSLIGDLDEAADYVAALYAAVSDIALRDFGIRVELSFVRLWDTPEDLFNEPDPLQAFRNHWNKEMKAVERDTAQLLSGRRNLPWGGVAYLNALCGEFAYSCVGYVLGFFPDLDVPSVFHFDVMVTAHELGHNFGANHTHAYGLDNCNLLDNTPQRGTIMSYCSQTVSGANSVVDLHYHTFVASQVEPYLAEVECLHTDCDGDGVDDAEQLGKGAADVNANGILDSCEDCDGDGTLDDAEILAGAADLDGNGRPDICDSDCNGNGIPDALDIGLGASDDLWGNGIPDECEADCDGNGVSDYTQIQLNLPLDLNRNRILDSCEDCDDDGTIDLVELDGAWNAWIGTTFDGGDVFQMHAVTGTTVGSTVGAATGANDLVISPDRRVFVSSASLNRIVEIDDDGSIVGALVVGPGPGGLSQPAGLLLPGDGTLLVASRGSHEVHRYSLANGAFLGKFVTAGSGGLVQPFGLALGPDGDLYVNGSDNRVRLYDGGSGVFVRIFAQSSGELQDPRGMVFLPDGDLVVASRDNKALQRYEAITGTYVGKFNNGGTTNALTFDQPWGLRIGPNGNVFAVRHDPGSPSGEAGGLLHDDIVDKGIAELHVNASRIYEFDVDTGNFIRSYVTGHDTGLWEPTGFDFMPGEATDCNRNNVPDSCDIARGRSVDLNGNSIPDECDGFSPDLNGDGIVDGADYGLLLGSWGSCPGCPADLTGDGVVDGADVGLLLAAWS